MNGNLIQCPGCDYFGNDTKVRESEWEKEMIFSHILQVPFTLKRAVTA